MGASNQVITCLTIILNGNGARLEFYFVPIIDFLFVSRLFSPVVIVPLVCVTGLGLFMRGFPMVKFRTLRYVSK